ncbi:hypothetical protein ABZ897_43105 [Nonomuraea sp. NPDC046802]|uniref:hypothetical protein n=1 Tax=Nonomuraea sp. NPDC046802 TaxID=3154919 RepID=UPI0033CAF2A5
MRVSIGAPASAGAGLVLGLGQLLLHRLPYLIESFGQAAQVLPLCGQLGVAGVQPDLDLVGGRGEGGHRGVRGSRLGAASTSRAAALLHGLQQYRRGGPPLLGGRAGKARRQLSRLHCFSGSPVSAIRQSPV